MINITFEPDTLTLDINGHAEHGKKGEDIVCSAISTLFYTLASSLHESKHMMTEDIDFSDEDGNGHISCKPKKEFEPNVSLMYWTILNGFQMVADEYKKNVKLTVGGV